MAIDLFSTGSIESIVRKAFSGDKSIDLKKERIEVFKLNPGYETQNYAFSDDNKVYPKQIRAAIDPLSEKAEQEGYGHSLYTALYEAVLNAHQHGNKMMADKQVVIAHRFTHDDISIAIIDQGGIINPQFVPFVLSHRDTQEKPMISWYKYLGIEKPENNNGTGTSFMHCYVDRVSYYKGENGGLVVLLQKKKEHAQNKL